MRRELNTNLKKEMFGIFLTREYILELCLIALPNMMAPH